MRRLLRSPWIRVFLLWTAVIAVLAAPLVPAAATPLPRCAPNSASNPDPALPPCPPDDANYAAIGVFLLVVLWLAVGALLLIAFAGSCVGRWIVRRHRRR